MGLSSVRKGGRLRHYDNWGDEARARRRRVNWMRKYGKYMPECLRNPRLILRLTKSQLQGRTVEEYLDQQHYLFHLACYKRDYRDYQKWLKYRREDVRKWRRKQKLKKKQEAKANE